MIHLALVIGLTFASLPSDISKPMPAPVPASHRNNAIITVLDGYMSGRAMPPWYMESIRSDQEAKAAIQHYRRMIEYAVSHYDDYRQVSIVASRPFGVSVLMDSGVVLAYGRVEGSAQVMFFPHSRDSNMPGFMFYDPNITGIVMAGIHWRSPVFEAALFGQLLHVVDSLEGKPAARAQPGSQLFDESRLAEQLFTVQFLSDATQGEYHCVAEDIARRHLDAANFEEALSALTAGELRKLDGPILCESCDIWLASYTCKVHLFAVGLEWLRLRGLATRSEEMKLFKFILRL